jgi:hypothetical protein
MVGHAKVKSPKSMGQVNQLEAEHVPQRTFAFKLPRSTFPEITSFKEMTGFDMMRE